ncbi:MAG: flagellar biosynthesis protein FlhG [Planctomycetota bacterium]|jgi:flagellar biosynthesis protein FlhG
MLERFTFRRLRPRRRQKSSATPTATRARVVCVASGKGGTGKSVLTSNLAVLRAMRGERVLLIDFDAGMANAHLLLGVAPRHDLTDVLSGEVDLRKALVDGPDGLKLLSTGVGSTGLVDPTRRELDKLFRALRPLEDDFDLILIDHGAGMGYVTQANLSAAQSLLLVASHEITALSDAYALYKRATQVNPNVRAGVVINNSPNEEFALSAWERFRNVSQRFLGSEPEFVDWVPSDTAVQRSVQLRHPVVSSAPTSKASRAIMRVGEWAPLDLPGTGGAFFDRARAALR